ncbi:ankyrin repeat protein [Anaeramoeba ignava]|uniref:Ankyrin repeat protein n=1 Tax=Anaeramoeba ignava TaxID=1746090 RepID=A0A9Q0LAM0_ANAIG|nr:ankyrin repeat protein [Anaeramoeba ignava]
MNQENELKKVYEAIKMKNIEFFNSISSLKTTKQFEERNQPFLNFAFEQNSSIQIIKLLIEKETNLNWVDSLGNGCLHSTICNKLDKEIIELLISKGADISLTNRWKEKPLNIALKKNYSNEVILYLIEKEIDDDSKNKQNENTLFLALKNPNISLEIIKSLIEKGIDINSKTNRNETFLHNACLNPNISFEIIKYLISSGIDINAKNQYQETALHIACKNPNISLEIIQLFISSGIDINTKNQYQENILHIILKKINLSKEIIQFLIEKGCEINSENRWNEIPLHIALSNNYPSFEIIELLVEKGSKLNTTNNQTALHYACSNRNISLEIIEYLISKGIDVNSKNKANQTPFELAFKNGLSMKILILLLNYLNIFEIDNKNLTQRMIDLFERFYSISYDLNNFLKSNEFKDFEIKSNDESKFKVHKQFLLIRFNNNPTLFQKFINICKKKSKDIIRFALNFLYTGLIDFDNFNQRFQQLIQEFSSISQKKDSLNSLPFHPFRSFHHSSFLFHFGLQQKNEQKLISNTIEKQIQEEKEEKVNELFKEIGFDSKWIKEKEGRKGILKDLSKLYQQNETKDFTIICEEKEIKVHKLILQIRSELFKGMFELNVNDTSNQVHDYSGKSFETIQELIYFLYHDEFEKEIPKEIFEEFEDLKDFYLLNPKSILDSLLK